MSSRYITKAPITATTASASGFWSLDQALQFTKANSWPRNLLYTVETFTSSGTWTCPAGVTEVEYLVVAGGAGGGGNIGGGGGAGGFRTGTGLTVTPGTAYSVTVGAGGSAGTGSSVPVYRGGVGINSVFSTITSAGGGYGGGGGSANENGGNGGSGGGAASYNGPARTGGAGNIPFISPSQGNDGGGATSTSSQFTAAGGGGASTAGLANSSANGGNGGVGAASTISGISVTYSGGGGGSSNTGTTAGTGGSGGGGAGGVFPSNGVSGTANTGGGGGGGGSGAAGGSGIVIIRYALPTSRAFVFTSSGSWRCPEGVNAIDYLVVAGGGGGGLDTFSPTIRSGGGGGAGGFRTGTRFLVTAGSSYTITVGGGGTGGTGITTTTTGSNGTNSVFGFGPSAITSAGGGGGGGHSAPPLSTAYSGNSGGSGGGGANTAGAGGAGNTPSTSPSQGNSGGSGSPGPASPYNGGGGGGASTVGQNASASVNGNGGAGTASTITGVSIVYAGGGGGIGGSPNGIGGAGGGGSATVNGTANSGGGGGANRAPAVGNSGGAGIVIIRISDYGRDLYFNQTVLLLKGDGNTGVNNWNNPGPTKYLAFSDNSINNFTVTPSGETYGASFNPYSNNFSVDLAGLGDYVSFPDNDGFNFGSGEFTVEAWIHGADGGGRTSSVVLNQSTGSASSDSAFYFGAGNNGLSLYLSTSGSSWTNSIETSVPVGNRWGHAVWQRRGNTLEIYLDGVKQTVASGNASFSGTVFNSSRVVEIGRQAGSGSNFRGFISNLRVVKGTAVYTQNFTPLTRPLTAISGTALLTCQSNRFIDNSPNNLTATRFDAAISDFGPFKEQDVTVGSGRFDGSGDLISYPSSNDFAFPGDFTVEAWIHLKSLASVNKSIFNTGSTSGCFGFYLTTTNQINFVVEFVTASGGGGVDIDEWTHVACSRSSGTVRIFKNGQLVHTASNSTSTVQNNVYSGADFGGFISDLRVVKGTALYTSNFTPPSAPLTAITGTVLLTCQYRGAVNNLGFLDTAKGAYRAITKVGNSTQGSFSPFSQDVDQWSNYFDGTGDYLTMPSNTAFAFDAGAYTVEAWIYRTGTDSSESVVFASASTTNAFNINVGNNGNFAISRYGAGGVVTSSAGVVALHTWTHIAAVRNSTAANDTKLYVNGNLIATGTDSNNWGVSSAPIIGSFTTFSTYDFIGYISNLRVVKGTAVYTSAFTPPTAPLTAITNTVLLTCQSNRFVDNSSNAFIITRAGDTRISAFSPFAPKREYVPSQKVGSAYFDGSGDYLSGYNTQWIRTNSFTIEAWIYPLELGITTRVIIQDYSAASSGYQIRISSSRKLTVWIQGASSYNSTSDIQTNCWTHILVSRDASWNTLKCFINGQQDGVDVGGVSSSIQNYYEVRIGESFKGYISNIRLSLTATVNNFPVPTVPRTLNQTETVIHLFNFDNAGVYDATGKNVIETVGNVQVDTRIKQYGLGSLRFDGTGDYLRIPYSDDLWFGSGDWTVEFWVYPLSFTDNNVFFDSGYGSPDTLRSIIFYSAQTSGLLRIAQSPNGSTNYDLGTGATLVLNQWQHVAFVRIGSLITTYLNGTASTNITAYDVFRSTTRDFFVGIQGDFQEITTMHGHLDDFRITKGVARYTANFIVPTSYLPR